MMNEHERHLELRKTRLGSTDIAPIMGLSKWQSAWQVWARLVGEHEPEDIGHKPAVMAGRYFESGVLDWAEKELGSIKRDVKVQRRDHGDLHLVCQIDGVMRDGILSDKSPGIIGNPVEAKTAGLMTGYVSDEWGEPGTAQIPREHIIQAHVQMFMLSREVCFVPASIFGRGFQMFCVERSNDLIEEILKAAANFWRLYVATRTPPPDPPPFDYLKAMGRQPKKTIFLPPDIAPTWDARQSLKARLKEVNAEKKEIESQVRAEESQILVNMGDAEVGIMPDGSGAITYFETKGHDVAAYSVKPYRTMRHKKNWKGE